MRSLHHTDHTHSTNIMPPLLSVECTGKRAEPSPDLTSASTRKAPTQSGPPNKKMMTRLEHGLQLKKPSRDLPEPMACPTPRKVQLNASMKFCLSIVKELLSKKHWEYAWPFYDPVSLQQYPDYLDYVKKPIDLTTIKTKIETGQYKTVKPFVKDMRLMVTNCLRYNKPEAPIIEQARKLRDFFEYQYARIPEELLKEKMPSGAHSRQSSTDKQTTVRHKPDKDTNDKETDSESHHRMKLLETQVKLLTTTISALTGIDNKPKNGHRKATNGSHKKRSKTSSSKKSSRAANRSKSSKSDQLYDDDVDDEEDDDEEMGSAAPSPIAFKYDDMDDLQQLKTDLENLDASDLKNVLRILRLTEPSIKCDNDENIEIDFEVLKPETLIALRKYVSSCMLNSKPKKSGKSLQNGSNCDMTNGNTLSTAAATAVDSTTRLSDSSSDEESDSSSDNESDDE